MSVQSCECLIGRDLVAPRRHTRANSYGGLTCFLAAHLDRDAIFESMRRRHDYASTGNRMILDVTAELPIA